MTFYQQLALIFVGTAFSVFCNLLIALWIFRWKKREAIPQDVGALKAAFEAHRTMTERILEETDERQKDFAIVQIQQGRDLVGLRGQLKYLQGIINGKFWKRADDVEDVK